MQGPDSVSVSQPCFPSSSFLRQSLLSRWQQPPSSVDSGLCVLLFTTPWGKQGLLLQCLEPDRWRSLLLAT